MRLIFFLKVSLVFRILRASDAYAEKCLNFKFAVSTGSSYNSTSNKYSVLLKNFNLRKFEDVEINAEYHLFQSNGFPDNGKLIESNKNASSSICYDKLSCYYLFVQGHANYVLSDGDKVVKEGYVSLDNPSLFSLGECYKECDGNNLIIAGGAGDFLMIYDDEVVIEKEEFDQPFLKKICLKHNECRKVYGDISYLYSTDNNDLPIQEGNSRYGFKTYGSCSSKCHEHPNLVSSPKSKNILSVISGISGMEAMIDVKSAYYKAACWLIYDDLYESNVTDHYLLLQRYILVLLYFTSNGEHWYKNYDFLSPNDVCEWSKLVFDSYWKDYNYYGIHCNEDGTVKRIILIQNNLTGALPHEISWLTDLEYLHMRNNDLRGFIPEQFGFMKKLNSLFLYGNSFTGSIPKNLPPNLQQIVLFGNMLTGTLPDFPKSLIWIDISDNLLTGSIPYDLGQISKLEYFGNFQNSITGTLPTSIGNLADLMELDLASNKISGTIPSQLFTLPYLHNVWLQNNLLTGNIPNNVLNGSSVRKIIMNNNDLTGIIPQQLSHAVHLEKLHLHNNSLFGVVPFLLTGLKKMNEFFIQHNNITGVVPFQNCTQFSFLEADCDSPQKVTCECCTSCFGIFNDQGSTQECGSGKLELVLQNLNVGQKIKFSIENAAGNAIEPHHLIIAKNTSVSYTNCISVSDCFTLSFDSDTHFPFHMKLLLDGTLKIQKFVNSNSNNIYFGYSRTKIIEEYSCNPYHLCNNEFGNSTKRYFLNKLVKLTNFNKLQESNSYENQASCDLVKVLQKENDETFLKSEMLQHYILSLFYYATNGNDWKTQTSWVSNTTYCSWYGIKCDQYNIVTGIYLDSNNLNGYIPSEIGDLRGLQYMQLNNNQLTGSIPIEIANLQHLREIQAATNGLIGTIPSQIMFLHKLLVLDLSNNLLSNHIPGEIGMLQSLESLKLHNNSFSGELPNSIYSLRKLKILSLLQNLLAGDVSRLSQLSYLEYLNLKNNFFIGKLPIGESHANMIHIDLSENQFTGSIPSTIAKLNLLEELILQDNQLTGTIPSQMGMLIDLSTVSLSYNKFKGSIPQEMYNLKNLKLLHLHSNDIIGDADILAKKIDYITDCGSTSSSDALTVCTSCSFCCNNMLECISQTKAWPHGMVAQMRMRAATFVTLLTISCFAIFFGVCIVLSDYGLKISKIQYKRNKFQDGSIYKFILTDNNTAIFYAVAMFIFHVVVLSVFMDAADYENSDNEAAYMFRCPSNSLECDSASDISLWGKIILPIVITIYLAADFIDGILLVRESIRLSSRRGILAGTVLLFITAYSLLVSLLFNFAIGASDVEIIVNAVILLFLNDMDERLFNTIKIVYPEWLKELETYIEQTYDNPANDSQNATNSQISLKTDMSGRRSSIATVSIQNNDSSSDDSLDESILLRHDNLSSHDNLTQSNVSESLVQKNDLKTTLKIQSDSLTLEPWLSDSEENHGSFQTQKKTKKDNERNVGNVSRKMKRRSTEKKRSDTYEIFCNELKNSA